MLADDFFHLRHFSQIRSGFAVQPAVVRDRGQFAAGVYKQRGDEDRLGHFAILVGGRLEGLARRRGEAVQVQAIVPVGAADQRQPVGSKPIQCIGKAALQVVVERRLGARLVVVRHRLVQDAPVAGLLQIRGDAHDEPERIVVETATDVVVAPFGQRLILVVRAAGRQLRCGQVQDAFPCPRRRHVHKTQQILVRVAKAEPPPDSRFIERRRARQIERSHALIRVPDIHHAVGVNVRRIDLKDAQQAVPVLAQPLECRVGVAGIEIFGDDRLDQYFVDGLRVGGIELLVNRVLMVAQQEDDLLCLTGLQLQLHLVRPHRRPPMRNRVGQLTGFHGCRLVPAAVAAQERLALRVESRAGFGTGEVGEVVAALAVLRLVIDHAVFHLHLPGVEISLEVGGVVLRIPQAELDAGEPRKGRLRRPSIRHRQLPDFQVLVERHKVAGVRLDGAIARPDRCVAHAVAARIVLQLVARRLP